MLSYLRNIRIRTFSNALIIFMIIAGCLVGATSYSTLSEVNFLSKSWKSFSGGPVKKTGYLSDLRQAMGFGGFIHNFKNAVLRRDKSFIEKARANRTQVTEAIANYRSVGVSDSEEASLKIVEDTMDHYYAKLPILERMIDQNMPIETIDDAVTVSDDSAVDAINAILNELRVEREHSDALVNGSVDNAQSNVFITLVTITLMIVLLVGVFLWFAQNRLIRPIYRLMEFVNGVGSGDLSKQISDLSEDEMGTLGAHFNEMVASLKDITIQTRSAVDNLNSAAAETLASTKQQSASVEEQFAAIQETTATLEEINQSGQQMSTRAREIAEQAEKASESSRNGLRSMDDMAQAMDTIEEQTESVAEHIIALSEKTQAIGEIIATVNDIAERSQLLALNAAIEAATAGEHGRTFSVVAEEIKTLADQAKEATNQVSTILGDIQKGINSSVMSTEESVKRVAVGREQAANSLAAIRELTDTIETSVQAFEQIVASTNQQRVGLDQVSAALQQIRAGSEQTAAGTKQIELAVTNIGALGGQLGHAMERYAV
ncbi:MAG: methyl-accepting chemotaxis protein [Nitratireductor sp.]|nr:methyl-accepting chemotaxis protein [Nitratireductor sp.]